MVNKTHRRFGYAKNSSSNNNFHRALSRDPLEIRTVRSDWARAYFSWYEYFLQMPRNGKSISVIQGTGDKTLNWKTGLKQLAGKFPNASIKKVPEGGHHLINDKPETSKKTYGYIMEELNKR